MSKFVEVINHVRFVSMRIVSLGKIAEGTPSLITTIFEDVHSLPEAPDLWIGVPFLHREFNEDLRGALIHSDNWVSKLGDNWRNQSEYWQKQNEYTVADMDRRIIPFNRGDFALLRKAPSKRTEPAKESVARNDADLQDAFAVILDEYGIKSFSSKSQCIRDLMRIIK